MATPHIRTARLLLRPWRDDDLSAFAAMNADARVMEFMPSLLPRAHSDDMVAYIGKHFEKYGYGLWAVETDDAPFIGYTGLHWSTFEAYFTPALEVGFRLAAEHWGKGYATEGGKAAVAWAFANTDLPAIHSWTAQVNHRSISAIRKVGLKLVPGGEFNHPRVPAGHPLGPHNLYRITRDEWGSTQRS